MNRERKLIYVILNDEDVDYELEEQDTQYVVYIRRQKGDSRELNLVSKEIKQLFDDADLNYDESVKSDDKKADIVLTVQRS
ncbi:hypothetical protein ACFP3T_06955 [Lactiplantibacillus dongliensis]|uniref:Uncharacterized protein n=1 Tax=Lactiplantibacillus dongliensis TaxID=2559919 RepID=A0ABW1R6D6_9LACO|nr:hypothetical protein [Lactiplantibacillus dongliensis]